MRRLEDGPEIEDLLGPYRVPDRRRGRPWTLANMVSGLDGGTAIEGRVGALSSGVDAVLFRALRALADVVLVGAGTVRAERYGPVRLDDGVRRERSADGLAPSPPVAVVSRSLDLDLGSPLFTEVDDTIVVTCAASDAAARARVASHARVVVAGDERVDVAVALDALAEGGHRVVLCEGGPTLLGEVVAAGRLDELCLTLAPMMGADPLPVAVLPAPGDPRSFALAHLARDGDTLFLRYERR